MNKVQRVNLDHRKRVLTTPRFNGSPDRRVAHDEKGIHKGLIDHRSEKPQAMNFRNMAQAANYDSDVKRTIQE